jgi:hypothetical protein
MVHLNRLVARALLVCGGDEADTQRMRAEAAEVFHLDRGHADAMGKDPAHCVGVQRAGRGHSGRRWPESAAASARSGRRPSHRAPMGPENTLQRALDIAVRRIPCQVVEPVHFIQCRQPPADRRRRVAVGQTGEMRRRFAAQRERERIRAPHTSAKMRPVRLVGAQRGCGRGLFNQRLRRGKRRQARRCQRLGGGRVGRRRSVDLP